MKTLDLDIVATRGAEVESRHRVHAVVVGDADALLGVAHNPATVSSWRSCAKPFQIMPLLQSGGFDELHWGDDQLALACASHGGEPVHVEVARRMLAKSGSGEDLLECGAHPPSDSKAAQDLAARGLAPLQVHNNCSGKHAGMLAVAAHAGAEARNYSTQAHPVQRGVAAVLDRLCDVETTDLPCGVDGCSVPTWGIPLRNLALGFQRFLSGETLAAERARAAARITHAVRMHPYMVAGRKRFCTALMEAVPRAFVKTGAEGVFCGGVAHAGIGIALKCDDGTHRASEIAMAAVLLSLDAWTEAEREALSRFARHELSNWRRIPTGTITSTYGRNR